MSNNCKIPNTSALSEYENTQRYNDLNSRQDRKYKALTKYLDEYKIEGNRLFLKAESYKGTGFNFHFYPKNYVECDKETLTLRYTIRVMAPEAKSSETHKVTGYVKEQLNGIKPSDLLIYKEQITLSQERKANLEQEYSNLDDELGTLNRKKSTLLREVARAKPKNRTLIETQLKTVKKSIEKINKRKRKTLHAIESIKAELSMDFATFRYNFDKYGSITENLSPESHMRYQDFLEQKDLATRVDTVVTAAIAEFNNN